MKIWLHGRHLDVEKSLEIAKANLEKAYCATRKKRLENFIDELNGKKTVNSPYACIADDYPLNALCDIFDEFDDDYEPTADAAITLDYIMLNDKRITDDERKLFYARYKDKVRGKALDEVLGLSASYSHQKLKEILRKLRSYRNRILLNKGLTQYLLELQTSLRQSNAEKEELKKLLVAQNHESVEAIEAEWSYEESDGRRVTLNRTSGIEWLGISVRLYNCLAYYNIKTIGDLLNYRKEFSQIRGLGKKTFDELKTRCEEIGLPFEGVYYIGNVKR